MSESVTLAMVQDNFLVGDIRGNADKIIQRARQAQAQGASLAVFPELALTGYPPEDLLLRPGFIAWSETELIRIREQLSDIDIVLGLPFTDDGQLHNSAVWIRAGESIAVYHKQRLPNYSVFDEVRYFEAGEQVVVIEHQGIRFGLSICEDVWVPQPSAQAKQQGADIILVINASPFHMGKYLERVHVLQKRVEENSLPMLYLNMVGGQDELVFDGESLIVDAEGEVRYRAPAFEPAMITVQIDASGNMETPAGPTIALSEDEAVYRALVTGVRDFVRNNGFNGVVVGLSGGVDSALTLTLAVDALGADNVRAVLMPSRYTADISLEDAIRQCKNLAVRHDILSIEPVFNTFLDLLSDVFAGSEADTTEENIQARCRGLILMAISNKTGRMVLTTGNKSEMAVGYATLYGDMSGGFAPLKDVSKTLVYRLCRFRNSSGEVIPQRVLTRPPSAELRPDQVDQDSLPNYDVLDRILEMSVEQDMPVNTIVATGIDQAVVERVISMVQRNEYKRRQAAPGVRITRRAFGRDRRYPITSGHHEPV